MKQKVHLRKIVLSLVGAFVLLCILPNQVWAEDTTEVSYLDGGTVKTHEVSEMQKDMSTGWYAAIDPALRFDDCVVINGDVNLILVNGTNTFCAKGISITVGSTLTIWAQSTDKKTMGKLQATPLTGPGIGGVKNPRGGSLVVNGGYIAAVGGKDGAGIGGGEYSDMESITINGGYVEAESTNGGAGIGGGYGGDFCGTVEINGGWVQAVGSNDVDGSKGGAGIGGGFGGNAKESSITINGGTVIAESRSLAAGIGGGNEADGYTGGEGATVRIEGGVVYASSKLCAIGHGGTDIFPSHTDDYMGELTIGSDMMVSASNDNIDSVTPFDSAVRASACQYRKYAKIEPCTHGAYKPLDINEKTHTIECKYCGLKVGPEEHTFNEAGQCICGYAIKYTVTFVDGQGTTLKTETVEKGKAAAAPADPTREGYTFIGWDTDFSNVTTDLTVIAKWRQVTYEVTFEDGLENVLGKQTVVIGRPATAPASPSRDGYVFSGWDTDFSDITSDLTVKARWTEESQTEDTYTVVFVPGFGKDPVIQTVEKGGSATAPENPTVDGFTFIGWDKEFTSVTGSLTVTAQWKKNTADNEYTVKFVDGYSVTPLVTQLVKEGQPANPPKNPTREGYTFDGWDSDFSYVTGDMTVIAQWKQKAPAPSKPVSIAKAKVVLSASSFAYNGKVRKPAIKTIGGKKLKAGTDYTFKWSNASSKNVGSYTITITGKGNYTGVTKASYKINPKATSLKKPKKAKKAIKVKWKKQSAKMAKSRITGYQIQLATNSKFTKNKKTVNVKGYKKVSKKVKKLKGGKKYYIKIRTYKTVGGTKYYSSWSKVRTIKTKK